MKKMKIIYKYRSIPTYRRKQQFIPKRSQSSIQPNVSHSKIPLFTFTAYAQFDLILRQRAFISEYKSYMGH